VTAAVASSIDERRFNKLVGQTHMPLNAREVKPTVITPTATAGRPSAAYFQRLGRLLAMLARRARIARS
jgi:hypothetical protein